MFDSIDSLQNALRNELYIADRGLATSIYLALKLERPLLLEGEPGVGKTEVAKVVARALKTKMIRLQCYEGIDINQAVYEWNYAAQIMHIRAVEAQRGALDEEELFASRFLLRRPLLRAIEESRERSCVLLIDEIDRSDDEFEAFLLELLSDFQISIPEIGTVGAVNRPIIILTSNRTRELHDALKRRCLYCWIDYPSFEKELEIVEMKVPGVAYRLAQQVTALIQNLRSQDLDKPPGLSETIDWATALLAMNRTALDESVIEDTLGVILKCKEDLQRVSEQGLSWVRGPEGTC